MRETPIFNIKYQIMEFNKYHSPLSHEELMKKCRKIKHVALDMDGTIYLGSQLFPFTLGFLKDLEDMGIKYSFLTNNPTKSVDDYLAKIEKYGIHAERDEMYTSSVATIDYLHEKFPNAKKLFVVGTPSMEEEFRKAGFELVENDPEQIPDVLIVAFDTTLTYPKLCHASWLASQGIPYIATNPDRVCPTDQKTILVDCGSLCKCIEHATGREPDAVIGKPNPDMLSGICFREGLKPEEVAMCGDRIYTDVATARNAGSLGVLVLSGETTLETALNSDPQPEITAENIAEFCELLKESRK